MSPDLAIPASPAALRNEGSGFLPLTAKAASFSGIGYASGSGVTLCMGQFQGGFALCTVEGVEILNENFERVEALTVEEPTQAYMRSYERTSMAPSVQLMASTFDSAGRVVTGDVEVSLTRLGQSSVFQSGIVLAPVGSQPGAAKALQSNPLVGPWLSAQYVQGLLRTKRAEATVSEKPLRLPVQLGVEWLNDEEAHSESQVTRVRRVADPQSSGMPLFVEETRLRIVARDKAGLELAGVDGIVRLDESPNERFPSGRQTLYTASWQFSYQADKGVASNLRPVLQESRELSRIQMTEGKTPVVILRSLASARPETGITHAALEWKAYINMCDAEAGRVCTPAAKTWRFKPGAVEVEQWVDQRSYRRGTAGDEPASVPDSNGVRDWLEAATWDTYSSYALKGGLIQAAVEGMTSVGETSEPRRSAYAETPSRGVITWRPWEFVTGPHQGGERFRWDLDGCLKADYLGLNIATQAMLTGTALHEARHSWQLGLSNLDTDLFPRGQRIQIR